MKRSTTGQNDRAFDNVFQFPNVSWPTPGSQLLHCWGGNRLDILVHKAAVFLREIAHQQRNVFRTFTQGGNADGKHVEPIVQITAEFPVFDHFFEVAVGGSYQADINLLGPSASQTFKLPFLQGAEQLGLDLDGNIANLVEKQRALIGELKPSNLLRNRPRKGSLLVSEEFTLQQPGWNGGAIQSYQSAVLSPTAIVDGSCD